MPAGNAKEQRLRLPVGTIDRSAARAGLARVGGIDGDDRKTYEPRFVREKTAQLGKAPGMQTAALALLGPNSFPDVRQIFDGNPETMAFSPRNDFLADAVVDVFPEVGLSLGKLPQSPLRRLGAAALQPGPALGDFGSERLDIGACVAVTKTIEGDVDDAEVDAENAFDIDLFRVRHITDASDVPLALDQHQIDLALAKGEQPALPIAAYERDYGATVESPDRNGVVAFETEDAVIEWLRGVLAECHHFRRATARFVGGVSVGNLGDAADGDLGRDAELGAGVVVSRLVQIELADGSGSEADLGHPITGLVAALERASEQVGLRARRLQLDVGNQFHCSIMERFVLCVKMESATTAGGARPAIPPRHECWGISRRI
jgi:hypothetical protein